MEWSVNEMSYDVRCTSALTLWGSRWCRWSRPSLELDFAPASSHHDSCQQEQPARYCNTQQVATLSHKPVTNHSVPNRSPFLAKPTWPEKIISKIIFLRSENFATIRFHKSFMNRATVWKRSNKFFPDRGNWTFKSFNPSINITRMQK